jgi:protocatechuate 3,4-dioxygenase beta subunit
VVGVLGGLGVVIGGAVTSYLWWWRPRLPTSVLTPTCVVRPTQTQGPYWADGLDTALNRSDIRYDFEPHTGLVPKQGIPLQLTFHVSSVGNQCAALVGAEVHVWHCDAVGTYSDPSLTPDPSIPRFLRGYQVTDAQGAAQFRTIFPGWYPGRAVHIHFKIRTQAASGQPYEFTSQLYFDDAVVAGLRFRSPYNGNRLAQTHNADDTIYQDGGSQLLLSLSGNPTDGYTATFAIGLQLP